MHRSFRGLDPHQGFCPWTPPGPLSGPLDPTPQGSRALRASTFCTLRKRFLINGAPSHPLPTGTLVQSYATVQQCSSSNATSDKHLWIDGSRVVPKCNRWCDRALCSTMLSHQKKHTKLWLQKRIPIRAWWSKLPMSSYYVGTSVTSDGACLWKALYTRHWLRKIFNMGPSSCCKWSEQT